MMYIVYALYDYVHTAFISGSMCVCECEWERERERERERENEMNQIIYVEKGKWTKDIYLV